MVQATTFLSVASGYAERVGWRGRGRRRFHPTPFDKDLYPPVLGGSTGRQGARLAFALTRPGHSLVEVNVSAYEQAGQSAQYFLSAPISEVLVVVFASHKVGMANDTHAHRRPV